MDDENLTGGLGQAEGLHQSLAARGWSRVLCCGLDDAFRVAGAVGHGIWGSEFSPQLDMVSCMLCFLMRMTDGPGSARVTE